MTDEEFVAELILRNNYHMGKPVGDGMYIACYRLMFHWTLIKGVIGDFSGYEDRWCYETEGEVVRALLEWNGGGDPVGWHRHPNSGRRRPGGDPDKEYVDW